MPKIVLVPTSHIARESLINVKKAVEKEKPDCIAVELDPGRYQAMKGKQSSQLEALKQLGLTTWLIYSLFRKLQNWLGKKVGIFPGAEMVGAVSLARSQKLTLAFIDQDIRVTFLRMKSISRREKLGLIWFILKGLTIGMLMLKLGRGGEKLDLNKIPPKDAVDQAMDFLRTQFPSVYRVLVTERNHVMAARLKELSGMFNKTVAVIGAGHCDGVKSLLSSPII